MNCGRLKRYRKRKETDVNKHERAHLETLHSIIAQKECQCDGDNYGPHPAEHRQYCPEYLGAYLGAILEGKRQPNPDAWPDAPEFCEECGATQGEHEAGCSGQVRKEAKKP